MYKFLLLCLGIILLGNSCAKKETTKIDSENKPTEANTTISDNYQKWVDTKKELDAIQAIIETNVNEYLENNANAVTLRDVYQDYDTALESVRKNPVIAEKMLTDIANLKSQTDYPEVEQIKKLFEEQINLQKISTSYLEKNLEAVKAGNSSVAKDNENLYIKTYQDAMLKNKEIIDIYSQTILRGSQAEAEKLTGLTNVELYIYQIIGPWKLLGNDYTHTYEFTADGKATRQIKLDETVVWTGEGTYTIDKDKLTVNLESTSDNSKTEEIYTIQSLIGNTLKLKGQGKYHNDITEESLTLERNWF